MEDYRGHEIVSCKSPEQVRDDIRLEAAELLDEECVLDPKESWKVIETSLLDLANECEDRVTHALARGAYYGPEMKRLTTMKVRAWSLGQVIHFNRINAPDLYPN